MDFQNDLLRFLESFGEGEEIDKFMTHFGYGTADVYLKDKKIIAAVRWNISKTGRIAHILSLYIKDGEDSIPIMRYFGYRGLQSYPTLRYIKFDREKKQGTKNRIYKLSSLIKG